MVYIGRWIVLVAFGAGLIVLIVALVMMNVSLRERVDVDGISESAGLAADSSVTPLQQVYKDMQTQNPNLSEDELLRLMEDLSEYSDGVNLSQDGDEYTDLALPDLRLPRLQYKDVSSEEIEDLFGHLKYGTDIDEKFNSLVSTLPHYLSKEILIPDKIDSEYFKLFSRKLRNDLTMVFLMREDNPETHIWIAQHMDGRSDVHKVCNLKGVEILDVIPWVKHVILVVSDAEHSHSSIVLIGAKDGVMSVLSYLTLDELPGVYKYDDDVTALINGITYSVTVNAIGNLVFTAENHDELVGVVRE